MLPFFMPLALAGVLGQSGRFALQSGDRVVFYGDSITDNMPYPQYVENYVVTRFPKLRAVFLNYGWSGDKVGGGHGGDVATRLSRDVFPQRATVVTIMLGMNDGQYRTWDEGVFNTYRAGYEHILDELKKHGDPRLTLIEPSPYDDVTLPPNLTNGGYNAVLKRFGDFVAQLGRSRGALVSDFNAPVVAMLEKAKETDPEGARKLIPDRVHPGPATHLVMADALLKTWNAPALVSSVLVDASTGQSGAVVNATVKDVKSANGIVTWNTLENALPFPFERGGPGVALVLKCSDVMQDLNQETLRVVNLPSGNYRISIDGAAVGLFGGEQLSAGINLAELDTPQWKQAQEVAQWTARRQLLRQTTWRDVVVTFGGWGLKQLGAASDALGKLETEIVERQHRAAQPLWRAYRVERVSS